MKKVCSTANKKVSFSAFELSEFANAKRRI